MDPAETLTGRTLGDYEVMGIIGRGGMAVVYKARQISLDRMVALKVLLPEYANDTPFIERFILEAKSAAKLRHPNIVNIHDICDEDSIRFFVMEFVDGYTLSHIVAEFGALPLGRAVHIAKQVVSALECAHRQNIIHRDIKSSNIMVDSEYRATVTDFGLAKPLYTPGITRTGTLLGTPEYMSPEQCTGATLDHRSDLYSLGVVLYEMLCAEVPFQGDTLMRVVHSQVYEQPAPLNERAPHLPQSMVKIVHKLLEKRPEDRFQTAADVLKALNALPAHQDERDGHAGFTDMATVVAGRLEKIPGPVEMAPRKGQKTLIGVGVAIALVAGMLSAWFLSQGGTKPGPATPTPVVLLAATPSVGVPATPTQPAPTQAPQEQTWTIQVESDPSGASIQVDGQAMGETPLSISLEGLLAATGQVKVTLEGYESGTKPYELGKTSVLSFPLKKKELPARQGSLTLSFPWAKKDGVEVSLDGKSKGTVASGARLDGISVGKHALTIRSVDPYVNQSLTVDVTESGTSFPVNAEFGKLYATASPWCYVVVDGVRLGETPISDYSIAAGEYRIEFVCGSDPNTRWAASSLSIKGGKPVSIDNRKPPFEQK